MSLGLDHLLTQYETGGLSRRELLAALATLVAAAPVESAAAPVGAVRHMNHVSVFVPDVKKSAAFYQDLLGLPLLTRQDPGINLNAGVGFLGIYPAPAGTTAGSINHFCFGMDNFRRRHRAQGADRSRRDGCAGGSVGSLACGSLVGSAAAPPSPRAAQRRAYERAVGE